MPAGDDVFSRMLHADLSKETWGAILSSGKPVGVCLLGISQTITKIKKNVNCPVFNSLEEMVWAMAAQRDFYARKATGSVPEKQPTHINRATAQKWISAHQGVSGEETLSLLSQYGIPVAESSVAHDESGAISLAEKIGYPVVMKVISPDAIHKSEVQGVMVDIKNHDEVKQAFLMIKKNLAAYKPGADFQGVRVQKMAAEGYDMFIGGKHDKAFGPVVYFGFGGVYVEIFKDIGLALCPSTHEEIETKIKKLKSYTILKGSRRKQASDIQGYIESIVRVSHLLADFSQVKELDINPLRILSDGTGIVALDARIKIA
jgi:acetyltransferase